MTFPTVETSIAFTTDPLDTPTWTVLATSGNGAPQSLHITTGRQVETDEVQPGTLSAVYDNSDRRYDPKHASGSYYGNLKPRKRIRVRATISAVTYDLYYGFVQGFPQRYSPPAEAHVSVAATDWFGLLSGATVSASVAGQVIAALLPSGWWRLGERNSDGGAFDSSGNSLHGTYTGEPSFSVAGSSPADRDTAISLPAATDWVEFPKDAGASDTDPFSVVVWYKGQPVDDQLIFQQGISPTNIGQPGAGENSGTGWFLYFTVTGTDAAVNLRVFDDRMFQGESAPNQAILNPAETAAMFDGDDWHMVAFTVNGTTLRLYWDGVEVANDTSAPVKTLVALPLNLVGPYAFDEPAIWHGVELSAADILSIYDAAQAPWADDRTGERLDRYLDLAGIDVADADTAAGITVLGGAEITSGSLMEQARVLNVTEDGQLFVNHQNAGKITFRDRHYALTATRATTVQATFTDDPAAGAGAYRFEPDDLELLPGDEQFIYNEAAVEWEAGTTTYRDTVSVDEFGLFTLPVSTLITSGSEADDRAHWIVSHYKDPLDRLSSLKLRPCANPDLWVPALGLQFGDLVAFRLHPQSVGTAIELEMVVQGIDHDIAEGVNQWETTFYLSPADALDYWIIGTGALGTSTALAY